MTQEAIVKTLLEARLRLCAGLWAVLRDTHAIEDIFQVTVLRAVSGAESLRDENHALAWARTTARNLAIDHIRKHSSRMTVLDDDVLDLLDAEMDHTDAGALAARLDALKNCVEKLPPRSRSLVEMRYHEKCAGETMARRMKLSLDAVYQALRRVHLALRQCVEKELQREG